MSPVRRARLCAGSNAKGKPCAYPAAPESDYCFRHEPQVVAERALAPAAPPPALPDLAGLSGELTSPSEIHAFLAMVTRYAALDPAADLSRVHAIAAITAPLLRLQEARALENRLTAAREETAEVHARFAELQVRYRSLEGELAAAQPHVARELRVRAEQLQQEARDQRRHAEELERLVEDYRADAAETRSRLETVQEQLDRAEAPLHRFRRKACLTCQRLLETADSW